VAGGNAASRAARARESGLMRKLLLACIVLAGCARMGEPLPAFNTVPDFQLVSQSGDAFLSEANLKGKVWIADFIFTTCTGPCPRMSSQMKRVQKAMSAFPEVRLVSFTVDPENDTPTALAEYAKRYAADPARWFFLTGDKQTLHKLNREAFMLGNVDGSLDHSTRFILIDRAGRVRKYYHTNEGDFVPELVRDVRGLLRERAS
jgi:protein SCO1/2